MLVKNSPSMLMKYQLMKLIYLNGSIENSYEIWAEFIHLPRANGYLLPAN